MGVDSAKIDIFEQPLENSKIQTNLGKQAGMTLRF